MFGNEEREVCVAGLSAFILEAVPVYGDDPVGVLIDNDAPRVHAEGAHMILIFLCAVYDFALVQFVGNMGENFRGQFNPYPQIHAVGFRMDL